MREIKIGEQTIRVRATPLALFFYKQEFDSDLVGDLSKVMELRKTNSEKGSDEEVDLSKLDTVAILQMVWAMSKADAFGKQFPPFFEWLGSLETVDFSDQDFLRGVLEEATDGFFRTGAKTGAKKPRK